MTKHLFLSTYAGQQHMLNQSTVPLVFLLLFFVLSLLLLLLLLQSLFVAVVTVITVCFCLVMGE